MSRRNPALGLLDLLLADWGGSLPGVLVAVAVGAILLGAFLSHVSTRMVSLGSVEESMQEQYAADSAAEFATWTLLNNTAFQDSVDAAYPNPVNVTPSITVNGMTPSLTAAAVNKRGWVSRAATPNSVNQGGDLTYGGGFIYALWWQGNSMNIWAYNPNSDSWSTLSSGPAGAQIGDGATITHRSGKIYAILGNKSDEFWEYTIGGSWDQKSDVPDETGDGSDMVVVGNDIYVIQGQEGNCTGPNKSCDKFWKYSIASDSWNSLNSTPDDVGPGGSLTYAGGNYIFALAGDDNSDFWSYELSSGNWSALTSIPGNVDQGGSLAFSGNNTIHALIGGGSSAIYSYDIDTSGWTSLDPAPAGIGRAGSVAWDFDEHIYVLRGDNKTDFWRFLSAPPKYDLTATAGTTTLQSRIQLFKPQADILWWDWQ